MSLHDNEGTIYPKYHMNHIMHIMTPIRPTIKMYGIVI